ncbi:amidohydrolase family protein [Actinacidiphila oryziradicis]|uniref:Amidohydrolase n=1 Tax=Actinacidiphila oryziradicis TaxID=2571141 RepID=A0A4U0SLY3_9ACTN|nr:amidohydrolase family protein [Actinacidiphila oryziradicis]TKA10920.1 amidohydrolase [Actinacidiphila oryziradicis]
MNDRIERIDAHHHFWDPDRYAYPWMAGREMDPVRRAFGPGDMQPLLDAADITGTVLVQTLSDGGETREFLRLAASTPFVRGVVGWVDLTSPQVGDALDALLADDNGRFLVGIRHQVHDERDPNWLCRDDVRRGLRAVADRGLSYDLLVRARELPAAVATVKALPELNFVVDHIAKPTIAAGADGLWAQWMPALAQCPNVTVKLSGMITEAAWASWTPNDLRPFVSRIYQWFGADRLMFGSDWPVCLLAGTYESVIEGLTAAIGTLSAAEIAALFGGTAHAFYRLGDRTVSSGA